MQSAPSVFAASNAESLAAPNPQAPPCSCLPSCTCAGPTLHPPWSQCAVSRGALSPWVQRPDRRTDPYPSPAGQRGVGPGHFVQARPAFLASGSVLSDTKPALFSHCRARRGGAVTQCRETGAGGPVPGQPGLRRPHRAGARTCLKLY